MSNPKAIKISCSTAQTLDLNDLTPLQGHLKLLREQAYKALRSSILEHGISYAIHVWKEGTTNYILDGHQRYNVLKSLRDHEGYEIPPLPVVFVEATSRHEAVKKLLAGASAYGEMTDEGLYQIQCEYNIELDYVMDTVSFPGIDLDEYKESYFDLEDQSDVDEDEIPEQVETKTKLGDLYQLGEHRLLCGDSTDIQQVERLMGGNKADLLLTDPPYGVSYTEKNEWLNSLGAGHRLTKAIENDSKTSDQMNDFWFGVLSNAHAALSDKSSYYICSPQGGDLMMMMMSIARAGFQLKHMLIWVKNNHVLGRCDYNYKHEPILYGWKENGTHIFFGKGRCKTSVWDFNKPLKNDLHPTMKPVELMEEALLNSSTENGLCLDLFGGSGSTLIACEKTNRKCFIMEIDPHYCDVIVARWEKYTGKKSVLIKN